MTRSITASKSPTKATRCAFCGKGWNPGTGMVNSQDGEKLICVDCIAQAVECLAHHDKLGTDATVIRPRCFNDQKIFDNFVDK